MIDKITLNRIKLMHPKLIDEVTKMYDEIVKALNGQAICRFSYTLRTFKEQDDLYALGRTKPGKIVTNAKGGQSYHNYGLAFDIVLLVDRDKNGTFESASWETNVDFDGDGKADWKEIVTIVKQYGWEWGGDWKFIDMPHFQKTLGYSVKQLNELYNNKKFIGNSNYVNI
jgi:peptidoglycan L-alanyl-D-glutamate endopeptidase CwlK